LVEVATDARGERRLESLRLESGDVAAALSSDWPRGRGALIGGEEDLVSLDVPSSSEWARGVVHELLPLAEEVRLDLPGGKTRLRLRSFVLPLDGDLAALRAHCTLQADDLTFRFPRALASALPFEERERITTALSFEIAEGAVTYDELELPAGDGVLVVGGSYDLGSREYALRLTLPDGSAFEVSADRDAPEVAPAED
jgi:hypothetical protein